MRTRSRRYATASVSAPDIYDVVCVGGGPAGLSLLTALRILFHRVSFRRIFANLAGAGSSSLTSHLRLALIESQSLQPTRTWSLPPTQFSNRASSLTRASVKFLEEIGAWKYIRHERVQPYHHMHVWDALSPKSKIDFEAGRSASDPGSAVASMTENQNLTRALLARLESLESISIFDRTSVASIDLGPSQDSAEGLNLSSYPHIRISSRTSPLIARLLVGADGLNSPVRNFAHISTRGWDYERHGVVATVRLASQDSSHLADATAPKVQDNVTAYQRFLPSGPIALLALPGDYASLVWSTTPEQAARLKALKAADFAALVNAAFRLSVVDVEYMSKMHSGQVDELAWRLKATGALADDERRYPRIIESLQDGSVASFPLRMRQADQYVGERIALVGDAAHTIHPLAGQGLNMGLADVASLVRTIEYSISHGADIGVHGNLAAYESEMWMKNNRMLGVVDKLNKLYGVSWGPLVGLRSFGLGMVDKFDGAKRWIMAQAGG